MGNVPPLSLIFALGGTSVLLEPFQCPRVPPMVVLRTKGGNIYGLFFWKCYDRAKANTPRKRYVFMLQLIILMKNEVCWGLGAVES